MGHGMTTRRALLTGLAALPVAGQFIFAGTGQNRAMSVVRALRRSEGFLYVLPALAFVVFFVLWPLAQLVYMSMTDASLLGGGEWVGLENYVKAFEDRSFWRALWFTVRYTVFITPLLMGLAP